MHRRENKTQEDLLNSLVTLINQMRSVADGLYKHSFDLDASLPLINKGVVTSIEKVLQHAEKEMLISEGALKFVMEKEPEISSLVEYVEHEEKRRKKLKDLARGKSKYFKMFHQGIQREERE